MGGVMGWIRCDDHPDDHRHEGFVQLLVREPAVHAHWVPVGACVSLSHGYCHIGSDELVSGVWTADRRGLVREYRVQVACECGWSGPMMHVPLGAEWFPCSLELDPRDDDAAGELWSRLHRDRIDEWPASLTQAWPLLADRRVG